MYLKSNTLDERNLEIYEYDYINNNKILIAKVYCVRKDGGVWELPAPQIFNDTVWENNQQSYEDVIQSFRQDCQNLTEEPATLLQNQITTISSDVENLEEVALNSDYELLLLKIDLDLIE